MKADPSISQAGGGGVSWGKVGRRAAIWLRSGSLTYCERGGYT